MIAPIVLIPLILAIAAVGLFPDVSKSKYIAIAGSVLSLLMLPLVDSGTTTMPWLTIGTYTINLTILITPLNMILLALVLLIGTIVLAYASGYMDLPSEERRFYFEMLAFEAAMAGFAMSGNLITLFIAWEFLSLTSYLLIGFWYERDSAIRAARKALMVIFIGDLALLASIILFWNAIGSVEFSSIIASTSSSSSFYIATILLLIAIFTKSAQFPFHEWLIDAMEGPTPVSAYLHSSTMVKAGVFAAIILFPLFSSTNTLLILLAFGIITAIISTFCAMRELHIKKVIAYSTIQELSIMMIAIGSGAVLAAIYFFFVQTFYKALLFFSSGNIMEATESDYINQATGLKSNKLIYYTTFAGVLSLAGFVPFSGFFANEGIGSYLLSSNIIVYVAMTGISLLTSFYIFRWFFYQSRSATKPLIKNRFVTQPKAMTYTMAVLALFTLIASAVFFMISSYIGSSGYLSFLGNQSMQIDPVDSVIFLIMISIGAALSYLTYVTGQIKATPQKIEWLLYSGPIINALYKAAAIFFYEISEATNTIDTYVNGISDSLGRLTMHASLEVRRVSVGEINVYALIVIIGILVMFGMLYLLVIA